LSVLAALYLGNKKRFDAVAPKIEGTVRRYFGRTAEEVESTGNSNVSAPIPESPWFASVNNSNTTRSRIVFDLMLAMEFSYDYAKMVSGLCLRREARLPLKYSSTLARLGNG